MDIFYFKVLCFFVILLAGFLGGGSPLWLGRTDRSERLFSLGNAFAGGVFLAAGLIHMLPDAREEFVEFQNINPDLVVSILSVSGFALVLFIEKVLLSSDSPDLLSQSASGGSSLAAYALLLVLSVHSIIGGIALGTEESATRALVIFIAIIGHKGTAAFALMVNLLRAQFQRREAIKLLIFFSLMSPAGIVLGSLLSTVLSGPAAHITIGGFDGIAGGTFLYVAVLDILEEEFARASDKGIKFGLFITGLALMALLGLWT